MTVPAVIPIPFFLSMAARISISTGFRRTVSGAGMFLAMVLSRAGVLAMFMLFRGLPELRIGMAPPAKHPLGANPRIGAPPS